MATKLVTLPSRWRAGSRTGGRCPVLAARHLRLPSGGHITASALRQCSLTHKRTARRASGSAKFGQSSMCGAHHQSAQAALRCDRRSSKVAPTLNDDRAALKILSPAAIHASDSWHGIRIGEVERHPRERLGTTGRYGEAEGAPAIKATTNLTGNVQH
jgi:hypothetical protein